MSKPIAPHHSMDIPHVTAVELPLIVKNTDKAVKMLGGKDKIKQVVNSNNKAGNSYSHTSVENTLELRLRSDPFHHPIQSSYNTSEKVLIKVSIPSKSIPEDYIKNPSKYSIRDLIQLNDKNKETARHRVKPVAIIDKTYLFKSIADFQISTKNNDTVQDFNKSILNFKNYEDVQNYFDKNEQLMGIPDYKNLDYYKNVDHKLPPPPVLSPIRFPFDYKYQKNPFTTAIKDLESGEIKVVSTKNTLKLHTKMIDYNTNNVPTAPAQELVEKLKSLRETRPAVNSLDFQLLQCMDYLTKLFEIKPIWLRKQLEDIVPVDLKKFIKQSLPYVSYIYKSGPWRFCNVKFGVDPKSDSKYWIYQSEYFRIAGLRFVLPNSTTQRIVPNTVAQLASAESVGLGPIAVSEFLFFNGVSLPSTVTYQIGDIIDSDITTIIQDNQNQMGGQFLRDKPEFQDGWINKQTMEVIRRIVRYKLNRIVKEEPIDQTKIYKIIEADYTENDENEKKEHEEAEEVEEDIDEDDAEAEDELNGNDVDEEDITMADAENGGDDNENVSTDLEGTMKRIRQFNPTISKHLENLVGFIKQDSIDD
ncbi:transcription factor [Suhomyces tanzawaensis NRRL Y-17324]|uniref:Transcription factor n=1 Tax=Suhomyces tanzawaensis NRRL Y-17324 TaxID=984487 RepID=A0A1E4SQG1_9ASCO|nr:transcription factor [Suhomyces tanzawaensis NRRL Y-17324]ODV81746.1 transcription factor [Suhomyces tanzawaensis NRRL Y-17324]